MIVGAVGERTEVAVIGAGPGGYIAALRAAAAGLEVTLIDPAPLGGTCLNVGCIPSKALIEVANIRHAALSAHDRGLSGAVTVDMAQVREHLLATTSRLRTGVGTLLERAGVTVTAGTAHFARYDRLSIEHAGAVSHLEFDDAIVATGSRPATLEGFPVGGNVVDSTGALALVRLPQRVAVLGGGYIGVELGTAFAKLGSSVTLIEAAPRILPGLPDRLGSAVHRGLTEVGVRVVTNDTAREPTARGLRLSSGEEITADAIVVAVGRVPNSDTCSLNEVGVRVDGAGFVLVGPDMLAAPNIYAIGDIVAGPALAHRASAQAEVAVAAILGEGARFDPAAIPAVVFSDPEVMTVGVSPDVAEQTGLAVHVFPHSASGRAHTTGATKGVTIVVCDPQGTVVGVHCVGHHASELAGEGALAIEMAATIEDLSMTIHAHPTMSETIAEAAWLARGMPLHISR